MVNSIVYALVLVFIVLLVPTQAKAYVDPGSGSLLLQLIFAAAVGALYHFRNLAGRLKWWK